MIQIRQANIKDVRKISYLIRKNTEQVHENNYTEQQINTWKNANTPNAILKSMQTRSIFCAFQNQRLVGTIGLQGNMVVGLYVSYTKRRLGIGRKLLQHLEKFAKSKNLVELVLTSTPSGKNFYASNGYKAIKPVIITIMNVDYKETEMRKMI